MDEVFPSSKSQEALIDVRLSLSILIANSTVRGKVPASGSADMVQVKPEAGFELINMDATANKMHQNVFNLFSIILFSFWIKLEIKTTVILEEGCRKAG